MSRISAALFISLCTTAIGSSAACTRPTGGDRAPLPPIREQSSAAAGLALDPERMVVDLQTLSADAWQGRFTKDPEHLGKAAQYIAQSHRTAGIRPVEADYLVDFTFVSGKVPGDGYYVWVERDGGTSELDAKTVLAAGFSEQKAVFGNAAWVADGSTRGVAGHVVVTPAPPTDVAARARALAADNAVAVLFVADTLPDADSVRASLQGIDLAVAFVTAPQARSALGLPDGPAPHNAQPLDQVRLSLARNEKELTAHAPNVLAWIEGSEHPEEIVLLGAHYDHIGTKANGVFCRGPGNDSDPDDTICNGADDNASGTALLMAIARAFAEAHYRPKRTLVFAHFAGEELGLLGSKALAERPPTVPPFDRGTVVAMLNMDMVGRLSSDGVEVGGEKTSPAWPALLAEAAPAELTVTHPAAVTGRSDHAHWFKRGVPVLFFFTGLHGDYHRTSDEFERVNTEGMRSIGTLVLGVTKALADGAEIPAIEKP